MDRIEAADYHKISKPGSVRLSPDGSQVAFVRREPTDEESYAATIHVASTDGSGSRQFTLTEGRDAEPRWSPSGDRIAFTSTRGATDDRQQLWVLPTTGGEARQVTDVLGGVSSIAWSPAGDQIAFVQSVSAADREVDRDLTVPEEYDPDDRDPRVIDRTVYRAGQQYFDGASAGIYRVELDSDTNDETTEPVARVTTADTEFAAPGWSDAATLYYTADWVGDDPDDTDEFDVVRHNLETDTAEAVYRSAGWGRSLAVSEDDRVAVPYTEPGRVSIAQTDLHVIDVETDDSHVVTDGIDRTLGGEAHPQWGPDGSHLFFSTPDEGRTALWAVPGDGSATPERVLRPGSVSAADVGATGSDPSDATVALSMSDWDHPGEVFVASSGDITRLTELNAEYLAERAIAEPEPLSFESDQGPVSGWVLTPPEFDAEDATSDGETLPLIVEVHGGPHAMWTTSGTMWHEFQTLAARGYAVFWSNPRGSTGYGEDYATAIERDWGEVTMTDVMAGVQAVTERSSVDADSVFLTGGSFGGYMTSWIIGQTDLFTAAVSQRGVYDLTSFYGSTDAAYKLVEGDFDTTPSEEPGFLWDKSPVSTAHTVDTPTLLIHSETDYRTPIATAELFHRILRKQGTETRLVRYPREGHELSRSGEPAHVVDRIERIARWFDGYSDYHDPAPAVNRGDDGLTHAADKTDDDGEAI